MPRWKKENSNARNAINDSQSNICFNNTLAFGIQPKRTRFLFVTIVAVGELILDSGAVFTLNSLTAFQLRLQIDISLAYSWGSSIRICTNLWHLCANIQKQTSIREPSPEPHGRPTAKITNLIDGILFRHRFTTISHCDSNWMASTRISMFRKQNCPN